MNRLKHQICNVFFPERAKERAKFLDREIKAGRGRRKRELGIVLGFITFLLQMELEYGRFLRHQ